VDAAAHLAEHAAPTTNAPPAPAAASAPGPALNALDLSAYPLVELEAHAERVAAAIAALREPPNR
jgi:hypothetical protein